LEPVVVPVGVVEVDKAAGVVVLPIVPLIDEVLTPRDARVESDLGGGAGVEAAFVSAGIS
jgi:hypothetical protein